MPLTGKEKRFLRSLMVTQPAIVHVGKGGLGPNILVQVEEALVARELVKIKLLNTSGLEVRETAEQMATQLQAEVVQLIGGNLILYRHNPAAPKIVWPGAAPLRVADPEKKPPRPASGRSRGKK